MATLNCPICDEPYGPGDLLCMSCGANLARTGGRRHPTHEDQRPRSAPEPPPPPPVQQPPQPYPPQPQPPQPQPPQPHQQPHPHQAPQPHQQPPMPPQPPAQHPNNDQWAPHEPAHAYPPPPQPHQPPQPPPPQPPGPPGPPPQNRPADHPMPPPPVQQPPPPRQQPLPPPPARREETLIPPEAQAPPRPPASDSTAFMCPHCESVLSNPGAAQCETCLRPLQQQAPVLRLVFPTGEVKVSLGQHMVLGRDAGQSPVAGTFTQYDNVSRRHSTVWLDPSGTAWVRDEGSTNGTFVNGERLPRGVEAPIRDGDQIRLAADVTGSVQLT